MARALRLLMVEDQQDLGELVAEALRANGLEVDVAGDAHQALLLMDHDASYDVLFSDISMPNGMSGIELANVVAGRYPGIRVVLASGHAKAQLPALPVEAAFLGKPYRVAQLIALLEHDAGPA